MSHGQDWGRGRQPPRPRPVSRAPRRLPHQTRVSSPHGGHLTRETAGPQVTAVWSEESLVQDPQRSWDRKACCYGWGLRRAPPPWGPTSTPQGVWGTHWPQPGSTGGGPLSSFTAHPPATGLLQRPSCPTRSILLTQTSWRSGQQDRAHNFTDEETTTSSARIGATEPQHSAAGAGQGAHRSRGPRRPGLSPSAWLHHAPGAHLAMTPMCLSAGWRE